jgi:DNA-binding XRE family transcriptional regulator
MANDKNHPIAVAHKGLRKEAGLDQVELSAMVGFSREKISAIENGHAKEIRNFTVDDMEAWRVCCQEAIRDNGVETEAIKWISVIRDYVIARLS